MALPNIYIRKIGDEQPTYELREKFNIYAMEMDYPDVIEVKDVERNDYFDEDGYDEKDTGRLYAKSFEVEAKFGIKGIKSVIYDGYSSFKNYLLGIDDKCTKFMMYDGYHGVGRRDMRLVSLNNKVEYSEIGDNEYVMAFTMKIKVNDPITDVIYDESTKTWK